MSITWKKIIICIHTHVYIFICTVYTVYVALGYVSVNVFVCVYTNNEGRRSGVSFADQWFGIVCLNLFEIILPVFQLNFMYFWSFAYLSLLCLSCLCFPKELLSELKNLPKVQKNVPQVKRERWIFGCRALSIQVSVVTASTFRHLSISGTKITNITRRRLFHTCWQGKFDWTEKILPYNTVQCAKKHSCSFSIISYYKYMCMT